MKEFSKIILIFAPHPILNLEAIPGFLNFPPNESSKFYTTFLLNHLSVISSLGNDIGKILVLNKKDEDFLDHSLNSEFDNTYLVVEENIKDVYENLSKLVINKIPKHLIFFFNTIGIDKNQIKKAFNLLEDDHNMFISGKTYNNKFAFIGANFNLLKIITSIDFRRDEYEKSLAQINKFDIFIQVMENFLRIENKEEFKKLYEELSKKESLSYCNESIHEKFTHFFIEFRENLK